DDASSDAERETVGEETTVGGTGEPVTVGERAPGAERIELRRLLDVGAQQRDLRRERSAAARERMNADDVVVGNVGRPADVRPRDRGTRDVREARRVPRRGHGI